MRPGPKFLFFSPKFQQVARSQKNIKFSSKILQADITEYNLMDVPILFLVEKYTIASMAWTATLKKNKEINRTE